MLVLLRDNPVKLRIRTVSRLAYTMDFGKSLTTMFDTSCSSDFNSSTRMNIAVKLGA
jgi:hypothetical protein